MSATNVRLLQAACEIAGGRELLAERLGIRESLLAAYLADRRALPDLLLLQAVDIIIEDRQARLVPSQAAALRQPLAKGGTDQ